jgi:glycosyltransferase involved in cell wall biosynthesis
MNKKKGTIVIDASRNRSGGAIVYLKNFLKFIRIKNTKIKKIIIFSDRTILAKLPDKYFLDKRTHPLLERNILFQIIWQLIFLPIFLKKNKIALFYATDSTSFCKYSPSIVFNQDILSFDKFAYRELKFGLEKIRLFLIKYVQIQALNNANEVIFLSKYTKKVISKFLKKNLKYKIIPHGVENSLLIVGKKKLQSSSWDYKKKKIIRLIYVSPLFHYKRQIIVAKAYTKLKKKYKNLDIKFVGNYKLNLNIYNKILKDNPLINKNNFTGEVTHKKVISLLRDSDLFLFASSSETFGISLLEGMALGMPIICSNKSSLPEILQEGGLYFNPNNYLELSKQIETSIINKKLRKNMSRKAFNLAKKYKWRNNASRFTEIANNLLN